jgi:uncharacterized membrane protein YkoI
MVGAVQSIWLLMRLPRFTLALATALAVTVLLAPRYAAARDHDDRRRDEVRRAVEAGEIRSLADILNAVRAKLPGEVAGVEIEQKQGRWRYEFRVIDAQGRVFEVYVDARNGDIERVKEK